MTNEVPACNALELHMAVGRATFSTCSIICYDVVAAPLGYWVASVQRSLYVRVSVDCCSTRRLEELISAPVILFRVMLLRHLLDIGLPARTAAST